LNAELRQCFCYSPPGILKYDFFAFGDIQLKVIPIKDDIVAEN